MVRLFAVWFVCMSFLFAGNVLAKGGKTSSAAENAAVSGSSNESVETKYVFDVSESKLFWEGSKVVGGAHNGYIELKEGHVVWGSKGPESATVVVDMNTIVNTDIKSAGSNKRLVGHLKNEDFFYVSKYPLSNLQVTSFKLKSGSTYQATGNITIRGVTQPITYDVNLSLAAGVLKGEGAFEVDRTKFNVKYNSKRFFPDLGDKIIKDAVQLNFSFVAKSSKVSQSSQASGTYTAASQ